ncbi:MAG: EamA family transporter [Candidatus Korobacteraceae bacterium]
MNSKAHPARGYLYIAAATFCWGLSAALGRAMFTGRLSGGAHALRAIDPLMLAQARSTISLLILAPILFFQNRSGLRVRGSHLAQFFLLGILGLAGSNYFYYFAIEKTTVATAIVLQYVAPVWVLLYMLARRLQRPTALRISGVLLAVVGCALAVGEVAARSQFPWLAISGVRFNPSGVVAAELAAITFAFYNVYGQHLLQIYQRWTVLVYSLLGAAVFWLLVNPPWKIVAQHYSSGQWLFMLVFAIGSMLIPFSLYFIGLQHLDPTRAIVTACLEPVWAILLTAMILGELVSPMQVVGIVVVLAATIVIQRPDRKAPAEPTIAVEPME